MRSVAVNVLKQSGDPRTDAWRRVLGFGLKAYLTRLSQWNIPFRKVADFIIQRYIGNDSCQRAHADARAKLTSLTFTNTVL
jgi:hypothetical protein